VVEGTNILYSQPSPAKQDVNSLTGQYKSGVSKQQYCLKTIFNVKIKPKSKFSSNTNRISRVDFCLSESCYFGNRFV